MLKYDPSYQIAKDYKPLLVKLVEDEESSDERKWIEIEMFKNY